MRLESINACDLKPWLLKFASETENGIQCKGQSINQFIGITIGDAWRNLLLTTQAFGNFSINSMMRSLERRLKQMLWNEAQRISKSRKIFFSQFFRSAFGFPIYEFLLACSNKSFTLNLTRSLNTLSNCLKTVLQVCGDSKTFIHKLFGVSLSTMLRRNCWMGEETFTSIFLSFLDVH